uniref:Secreted protein n=1 Tax=Achlya hypogyna TaxID=1202772 RepID=A0A0A7CNZ2_ACHHY|nr:secreted protein [Achlya hypogyna]
MRLLVWCALLLLPQATADVAPTLSPTSDSPGAHGGSVASVLGGDSFAAEFNWFNSNVAIHTKYFSVGSFAKSFWTGVVAKARGAKAFVKTLVHKLRLPTAPSVRSDPLTRLMTFDEYVARYNLTTLPPAVAAETPLHADEYTGPTYVHVSPKVAALFEPFPGYAAEYYAPPLPNAILPTTVYPWPWGNELSYLTRAVANSSHVNRVTGSNATDAIGVNATDVTTVVSTTVIDVNATDAPHANATASIVANVTVADAQSIDNTTGPASSTTDDVLLRLREMWATYFVVSGIPVPPVQPPTGAQRRQWTDATLAFYAHPMPARATATLGFGRSGVTFFAPSLIDPALHEAVRLPRVLTDAFDADAAALVSGVQAPSSTWYSEHDRASDEFADLCMGQLIAAMATTRDATALFNTLMKNSASTPSCLWQANAYYYNVKTRSPRKVSTTVSVAALAEYAAARARNATQLQAVLRADRAKATQALLAAATDWPPLASMGNGVVLLSENAARVWLQKIKEPQPLHMVFRAAIRLGESALLSGLEMDTLVTCTALRLLNVSSAPCHVP